MGGSGWVGGLPGPEAAPQGPPPPLLSKGLVGSVLQQRQPCPICGNGTQAPKKVIQCFSSFVVVRRLPSAVPMIHMHANCSLFKVRCCSSPPNPEGVL